MPIKATVQAFRPTMYGYQVQTDKGTHYVSKNLFPNGIEAGVQVQFEQHKKGDAYPASFKKEGTFNSDGIHDVFILRSTTQANIAFKHTLSKVEEEA